MTETTFPKMASGRPPAWGRGLDPGDGKVATHLKHAMGYATMTRIREHAMTTRSIRNLVAFAGLVVVVGSSAAVGPASAETAPQPAPPSTCSSVTEKSEVKDAYRLARDQEPSSEPEAKPSPLVRTVQLKDKIAVQVTNLDKLYDPACKNKTIVLFLDGRALKSLTPNPPTNPKGEFLTFELRQTAESRPAWNAILGKPGSGTRDVKVSVGFEDDFALKGVGNKLPVLQLDIIPSGWFALWCAIFVVMVVVFFGCVRRSNIIRDGSTTDGASGAVGTFSLSKSQGAWWFFVILAAYLLIGIVTGDFSSSINSTAVILLGIGAGTVIGSAVIDVSKDTPDAREAERKQAEATKTELENLKTQVEARDTQIKATTDEPSMAKLTQERADLFAQVEQKRSLYRKLTRQSESFLTDILSDANGVSFHRFQMAAWTLVLSIIFIKEVYENLAMPTFDTTLMGLLGLSAGTYLGLKIPEPTKPAERQP